MEQLASTIKRNKAKLEIIKAKRLKKLKIIVIVALFILLTALMTILIDKTVQFFRNYTIVKYQILKVETHIPFEIVSLTELNRRELNDQMIEDITSKAVEEYLKPKTGIEDSQNGCKVSSQIDPKYFFDIIRRYESGNGTNDNPRALHNVCKAKGMSNEIGYSPQTKFCFGDLEESQLYVAYYVKKNCEAMPLANCLCLWNTGKATDRCAYADGNLSLAN